MCVSVALSIDKTGDDFDEFGLYYVVKISQSSFCYFFPVSFGYLKVPLFIPQIIPHVSLIKWFAICSYLIKDIVTFQ